MNTQDLKQRTQDAVAASQAVAVKTKAEEITDFVTTTLAPSLDDVLQQQISRERFARIVLGAFRTTPKLMECTRASLASALMNAAALRLEPNGPLGEAYLIPYKDTCQFIIGYKGLLTLVWRSGGIVEVTAQVVRAGDDFEYEFGSNRILRHKPAIGERGDVTMVYAYAHLRNGGFAFEVMNVSDIEALRSRGGSSSGRKTPWDTDWEAMAKKTVLRRLCKLLPMSTELAHAVLVDETETPTEEVDHE